MIKILLCSFIFIIVFTTRADDSQTKTQEAASKWAKLMDLVNIEIKTIKENKYSGPELKHRLFELYSEKIKLIKEKENLNLLKSDAKTLAAKGKNSYFKDSLDQYQLAQKYAVNLIKDYPQYNQISEIYYALAINSRDFGSSEETEQFLKLSIQHGKDSSKTMFNAKTALAEFYYNNKRYKEAITYYQDLLKNKNDEWYGKHLYNASWCYLKEKNFKKALEFIKESFETTKTKKFVSMKEQINNAIGIFFVQADETRAGIEFYEQNTNPSAPWLLALVASSMNKNNFSLTEEALRAALKDTQKRKDNKMEIKVRLVQLDTYRETKKDELFFETSNKILELSKKYKIENDDLTLAINKIKDISGFMQINLAKDKTKEEGGFSKDNYKKIIRYFDILSVLDKKNKNQYRYYQGETALSVHEYQTSLKYYVRSVMNSKTSKDTGELTKKSLEAMLSTIELAKLKTQKENEYTIFAFKNYLLFYPKSDRSQAIYQKTFSKYFELHKIKLAVNILLVYKFNYGGDSKIHREMLTQILDIYIKEKNTDKLAFWISNIERGYLHFDADYIQNSIAILGGLLFDKYQAMEKAGKTKEAMNGYETIYDSKKYPIRTKAEAAYAIATIYQQQNNAQGSYKWLKRSLEIYDNKDLVKLTKSLLVLAKGYRLLQNFELSSELALNVSNRFCNFEFDGKYDFYELLMSNRLIEDNKANKILKLEGNFNNCLFNKQNLEKNQLDNFEQLISADDLQEVLIYFNAHSENEKLSRQLSAFLKFKFWQANESERENMKKDLIILSSKSPQLKLEAVISQYEKVKEFREKTRNLKFIFTTLPKFDDDKFNSELEQYFSIITELNKEAVGLSKDSTPEEVLLIREVLTRPYNSLVNSINNFTPQGVDTKYLEGFKKGMRQITEPLIAKASQIDREKMAILEKNNFFFEVQKHDKFENIKEMNSEIKNLNFHSAILFSNTIDLNRGLRKR